MLIITATAGQARTALCYVVDTPVAGDKAICLIGLRNLVDWGIDLQHHMHESLCGTNSVLRLLKGGITANAFRLNAKHNHGQNFEIKEGQQRDPCTNIEQVKGNPNLKRWLSSHCLESGLANNEQDEAKCNPVLTFILNRAEAASLHPFSPEQFTEEQCEHLTCNCPIRFAESVSPDMECEAQENGKVPPVDDTAGEERLETVLMSEIQIRNIVDRLDSEQAEQGTDGDETMSKDEQTISKFSRLAMSLGPKVCAEMRAALFDLYDKHVGQDKVFPTKNGPPKILEQYKDKPYEYELRDEYKNGSLQLPSVKVFNWQGKPATAKIIRDFIKRTPVVSPCKNPRCISRLVIVPKLAPGQSKESKDHGFRVTVNALFNKCLKQSASTIPLATDEILKLHGCRFFLQVDGLSAFWAIPVGEESRRLTAFHTPDGIHCWDRLLMGAKPSSAVQQASYLKALDDHIEHLSQIVPQCQRPAQTRTIHKA